MLNLREYNEQKQRIIEKVKKFITNLQKSNEISKSTKLSLDFEEFIEKLQEIVNSLIDDKVRVSVIAEVSNGKSTFLNALIFRDKILEARIGETTGRLYHISYGNKYSVKYIGKELELQNLDELKKFINDLNEETFRKAQLSKNSETKFLSISEDELSVYIYMPLENLRHGIEIIDTPGFGTLNESLMMKFIQKAINSSDAVITIFDISQGMKQSEYDKFSKLLLMIRPDKRYIVFNKIDAYEDEEANFDKVGRDVINKMNEILKEQNYNVSIEPKQLFYISAKLALEGFRGSSDERAQKYKKIFEEFERTFWNDVIKYKQHEFLASKHSSFERIKEIIYNKLESTYKDLSEQLFALKTEKEAILREQNRINKMAENLQKKANYYINDLKNTKLNTNDIIQRIAHMIISRSRIMEFIEENFNILTAMFEKNKFQAEISRRLSSVDMESILNEAMTEYYEPVFSKIRNYIQDYNNEVDKYNSELEKMNIRKFRFPKIDIPEVSTIEAKQLEINNIEAGNIGISFTGPAIIFAGISAGLLRLLISRLSGLAASRIITILNPIISLAGIIWLLIDLIVNYKKSKQQLKTKIEENIKIALYDMKTELDKINDIIRDFVSSIRAKFNEVKFISEEIIKMIDRADLDERINEIENQLDCINQIIKLLKEV